MKKEFMVKRILSVFLIVLGFAMTTYAQKPSPFVTLIGDTEVANQNVIQEIISLKSSLQSLTPGSPDYVDAMRRIEVYGAVSNKLEDSDATIFQAVETGRTQLYRKVLAKESETPQLDLIYQAVSYTHLRAHETLR